MLLEILFCISIIVMSFAIINFIRAALKTRKSFSAVSKVMIGFSLITIAMIDHAFASYFVYREWWTPQLFVTYRFFWELLMGIVEFYIVFEIIFRKPSKVDQLTREFERYFYGILHKWNGEISPFASTWFIIDDIFPITEWEHKKSVSEFVEGLMKKIKKV
ncbi:MAG: hypothetical protein ACTSRS_00450 [Candidatus Helarchaeota archaeon]